jgi:hypothetical protein
VVLGTAYGIRLTVGAHDARPNLGLTRHDDP